MNLSAASLCYFCFFSFSLFYSIFYFYISTAYYYFVPALLKTGIIISWYSFFLSLYLCQCGHRVLFRFQSFMFFLSYFPFVHSLSESFFPYLSFDLRASKYKLCKEIVQVKLPDLLLSIIDNFASRTSFYQRQHTYYTKYVLLMPSYWRRWLQFHHSRTIIIFIKHKFFDLSNSI